MQQRLLQSRLLLVAPLLMAVFAFAFAQAASAQERALEYYIEDGVITIDNDFSDWPEAAQVIDESGEEDVVHDYYCMAEGEESWTEVDAQEDCESGLLYSDSGQIDLQTAYFGVNETNMYLGFEAAWPMMGAMDVDEGEYISIYEMPWNYGVTTLPMAFDHDMVFAFGPADEETFEYYVVAHIEVPQDLSEISGFSEGESEGEGEESDEEMEDNTVSLGVYQESGDSEGWDENDTLLGTISEEDGETASNEGEEDPVMTTAFEVSQNIEAFYELTEMTPDSYGFRLETHSDVGDVTERVVVQMDSSALEVPTNLRLKNRKARAAQLRWDAVDGAKSYRVELRNKKTEKVVKRFKAVKKPKKTVKAKYLKASRAYEFRVRACPTTKKNADVSACSDWSEYKAFRTKPLKPIILSVEATVEGEATITLKKRKGKVKRYFYKLYDSEGELVEKGKATSETVTVTGLTAGETYTVKIRSRFNKKNRSKYTAPYEFTVPTE